MDSTLFDEGQTWAEYMASMTANGILMQRKVAEFRLADPTPFKHSAVRAVLVMTEDWCQDSISALPPLIAIADAAALEMRVFRRSAALALHQSLTGLEYPPVPTFVFYDSAWREQGRFLEMPAAFRRALQDPAEAQWLREAYDELWWQAEVEEIAAIFSQKR